jgi:hypothetical protein
VSHTVIRTYEAFDSGKVRCVTTRAATNRTGRIFCPHQILGSTGAIAMTTNNARYHANMSCGINDPRCETVASFEIHIPFGASFFVGIDDDRG